MQFGHGRVTGCPLCTFSGDASGTRIVCRQPGHWLVFPADLAGAYTR